MCLQNILIIIYDRGIILKKDFSPFGLREKELFVKILCDCMKRVVG